MRIALIGLGDIARKAYLPVLATDPTIEPVLVTRNPTVREELGNAWRVPETYEHLEEALTAGIDAAFVHAATEAHPAMVNALLGAGVPTLVDKPLADSYDEAARLVDLADRRRVGLMVGFNRRYAPAYREIAEWPDRDVVLLQKHRNDLPDAPRRVVFDDFIHVVDTLRFLVGNGVTIDVSARVEQSLLCRVLLRMGDDQRQGVGIMDRVSGATQGSPGGVSAAAAPADRRARRGGAPGRRRRGGHPS